MSKNFIEQMVVRTNRTSTVQKGSFVFHEGDKVRSIFVIKEGLIELMRPQRDGASIILQRAGAGTLLAEASIYSKTYHCDGIAVQPTSVFQFSRKAFLDDLAKDREFADLWSMHLAKEVQSARYRIEILSRNTVSERLDGWMVWKQNEQPAKGQWKSIAEQIGVSPEALYRELAKRRAP